MRAKTMRVKKPARASVKAGSLAVGSQDVLKASLLKLCDMAAASIAALRRLDLEVHGGAGAFDVAVRDLMEATYQSQGIGEALEAREKIDAAAKAVLMVAIDEYEVPGLVKAMRAEGRRKLAAAANWTPKKRWPLMAESK